MKHTMSRLLGVAILLTVSILGGATRTFADTKVFLSSAIAFDQTAETITLPLFKGRTNDGRDTWYIVTESSDRNDAQARGVNWSPKLANALGTAAVQNAALVGGVVKFPGTVDFSPMRVVVPSSPNGFPPDQFQPGAVGDANYSPYITTGKGIVLNASQVANNTGLHDSALSIDFNARRVTLRMFRGFYDGHPVLYLRMDGSIPLLAAIESSTLAPNMNAAPGLASNDKDTSARSAILPIVNGPRGVNNPQRQGLESALLGEGDPLNITQELPGSERYSPVWDVTPAVWTDTAIAAGQRRQLTSDEELAGEFAHGRVVSFGTGPANSSLNGLQAAGFISNCPIMARL